MALPWGLRIPKVTRHEGGATGKPRTCYAGHPGDRCGPAWPTQSRAGESVPVRAARLARHALNDRPQFWDITGGALGRGRSGHRVVLM